MAKNYDLIARLENANERPKITIAEGFEVTVNTSKTNVIGMEVISRDEELGELERLDKMIKLMVGEKDFERISKLDLSMEATQVLFEAITAAVSGEELEEVSARFQEDV